MTTRSTFWGLVLFLAALPLQAEPAREYQVKAAFLYNFVKFVEWPGQRPANEPIVIGLLDEDPFGGELEKVVGGHSVGGHLFVVRKVSTAADAAQTDVLFVGSAADAHYARLAPELRMAAILTVGETAAFARAGGVIRFILDGDRVRFAVAPEAARTAGLKISVQLLRLAVSQSREQP